MSSLVLNSRAKIHLSMLSVLLLISSFLFSDQHEWAWSHFPESGFKVLTPVSLIHTSREVPTEAEAITYHQYYGGNLSDTSLALAFVIDHYQIPLPEVTSDSLYYTEFFETTIDQILSSVGGSLVYHDILSNSERESCIWKATFQEGKGVIRGQMIYTGNKYYGLQVFGLAADKPDHIMNKFFESFRLVE